MKKIILLFFTLNSLLFSTQGFIGTNGRLTYIYSNEIKGIINLRGSIEQTGYDIEQLFFYLYIDGKKYDLRNYTPLKKLDEKRNIIKLQFSLDSGDMIIELFPSGKDKKIFLIKGEFFPKEGKKVTSLEFIYVIKNKTENGEIKYDENQKLYTYRRMKLYSEGGNLTAYIANSIKNGETKLKQVEGTCIKYAKENLILVSSMEKKEKVYKSDLILEFNSKKKEREKTVLEESRGENKIKWLERKKIELTPEKERYVDYYLNLLKGISEELELDRKNKKRWKEKEVLYLRLSKIFIEYGYLKEGKDIYTKWQENTKGYLRLKNKVLEEDLDQVEINILILRREKNKKRREELKEETGDKIRNLLKIINSERESNKITVVGTEFKLLNRIYKALINYDSLFKDFKYTMEVLKLRRYIESNYLLKDGIKRYKIDQEKSYDFWEYKEFNNERDRKKIENSIYQTTILRRYPYLSKSLEIDYNENLKKIKIIYSYGFKKLGDILLEQINKDIKENKMTIPLKKYIDIGNKYEVDGVDPNLIIDYLEMVISRGEN